FETPGDRRALLDVYDAVLDKSLDKHSAEFRTPVAVTRFLIEIAAPTTGDRVYDPCFGSAGLLTAACDHVLHKGKDRFSRSGMPALAIFGVERNLSAYVIGLTRLVLAGIDDPQLELANSLERTSTNSPQRDGFDVVLANPPWGMRADSAGLDHFPVRTTDTIGLFIQHALSQLRPDGRIVIVVPQGFLFRGGPEQRLRRMLLEQHTVEAVISLPHGVFLPYTGIQASVLVLRGSGPTKSIRMLDAEPFFEKGKGTKPATIQQTQVEDMVQRLRDPIPGKHCWDVDPEGLAEVNWDFTPKRRGQSSLMSIINALRSEVDIIPLKECSHILAGRSIKSSDLVDAPEGKEPIPYIRIRDVQRGQATRGSSWLTQEAAATYDARWKLRAGDVLLSKSGTIGKSGVVRNGAVAAVAANGLFVLRPDPDRMDPHFLAAYLDSSECRAWLDDMASGAILRHLSKQVFENLPVPLPPLHIQHRVVEQYREHHIDVLAYLAQLMTEGEDDPIAKWINDALRHLNSEWYRDVFSDNEMRGMLHGACLGGAFTGVWHWARQEEAKKNPLTQWILALREAVDTMSHTEEVPPGPAFFSLLQQAGIGLRAAEAAITGHLPNENKARDLMRTMKDRIDKA
ncbi:MAG: N-6 DNA methylase, partial [Gallionella sp.]|nr:N-6 DNA methylase [Gallionella sp.]